MQHAATIHFSMVKTANLLSQINTPNMQGYKCTIVEISAQLKQKIQRISIVSCIVDSQNSLAKERFLKMLLNRLRIQWQSDSLKQYKCAIETKVVSIRRALLLTHQASPLLP